MALSPSKPAKRAAQTGAKIMISYIEGPTDVIACTIRDGFTSTEMSALVSKVDQALKTNAKTHMFVEIDDIGDVDWSVLAEQLPRSIAILRQLRRFGRVGVVSDDPWIRLWTRAESALLPNISYELFRKRERDRALGWVNGRMDKAHAPSLTIIPTENPSIIAYDIDGNVTAADMDTAIAQIGPRLSNATGPVRVLARVGELDVPSFSALLRDRYLSLKKDTLRRLERYAVVGGPEWLRKSVQAMAPLFDFEIRHFAPADEAEAWQWIGAPAPLERETAKAAPEVAIA